MSQDFRDANLQGKSFEGQDLSGADFSYAHIQGVDFSDAKLVGADFSQAQAGLQDQWVFTLVAASLILAFVAGLDSAWSGASVGVFLVPQGNYGLDFLFGILALLVLIIYGFVVAQRGWGTEAGGLAVILAATITFVAAVSGPNMGASVVIQAVQIAGTVAGVMAGTLATTATQLLAGKRISGAVIVLALLGSAFGAGLGIPQDKPSTLIPGALGAVIMTIALIGLSVYATNRALAGDSRYALIRSIAIALCATKGTNFQNANLTETNFSQAKLKHTDLRGATLTNTNWYQAESLEYARTSRTYLADSRIRELLVTKDGKAKNFDRYDLRELNLQNGNFADASFIGADLSEANLEKADLSRAKLVQAQLYRTNLTHTCLTGAYIQDWAISTDTTLEGIKCDYIYMKLPTPGDPDPWRKPDDRQEIFKEGDFSDFIAPIVKTLDLYRQQNIDPRRVAGTFTTLDLYHYEGIDPSAAAIALKQLAEAHPEADLEVVALEGRGEEKVRLQARVAEEVDRSGLSAEYFSRYREISSLPYSDLQALLTGIAEKDERIRSLEDMVMTAIKSNKSYIETYYTLGDTVSEKRSINFQADGNIGDVSGIVGGDVSGVLNLGTISGNVTNAINQLPTSSDPDKPGLKELLAQLQTAIEAETELPPDDKAEALEQVKVLAEAGQKPEDSALQKAAKTAMKILKGTVATLSETSKLVEICSKLLPIVSPLLLLV